MKKWFYILLIFSLVINIVLVFSNMGLRSQIKEQTKNEAVELANKEFLTKFFTYKTIKERYEGIKPFMTEQGYNSTLPAGIELPEDTDESMSVSSRFDKHIPFKKVMDEKKVEFLNQFSLTTSFNKIASTQEVIVRTIMVYEDGAKMWKVDEVEFITTLGAPDA